MLECKEVKEYLDSIGLPYDEKETGDMKVLQARQAFLTLSMTTHRAKALHYTIKFGFSKRANVGAPLAH